MIAYDEKLFVVELGKRAMYVFDNEDAKKYLAGPTSRGSGIRVMVGGAYDMEGPGPLHFFDSEKVTAAGFGKLVRDTLYPYFVQQQKKVGLFDNAPSHKGVASGIFCELGIVRLDHPARSPDFNPIELCWNRMQQRINSSLPWDKHITVEMLKAAIWAAWQMEAQYFESDMLHVVKVMDKAFIAKGGNKF